MEALKACDDAELRRCSENFPGEGIFLIKHQKNEVVCLQAAYTKLLEFISANNLEITDFSREITLIDSGFTSDQNLYMTEIQIPVRQKNE